MVFAALLWPWRTSVITFCVWKSCFAPTFPPHSRILSTNRTQMTCLMLAAREGYSKIINLLLSHGADVDLQEENGHTVSAIDLGLGL